MCRMMGYVYTFNRGRDVSSSILLPIEKKEIKKECLGVLGRGRAAVLNRVVREGSL